MFFFYEIGVEVIYWEGGSKGDLEGLRIMDVEIVIVENRERVCLEVN